jgi:hypothetical protein
MLYLFRKSHSATQGDDHGSQGTHVLLHASLRLLLISFLMGLYFVFISLNNFLSPIGSESSRMRIRMIFEYANCIADNYGDLSICGDAPQLNVVGIVFFITQFLYSAPGLISFIILGMQYDNFVLWGTLLGCVEGRNRETKSGVTVDSQAGSAVDVEGSREGNSNLAKKPSIFSKSKGSIIYGRSGSVNTSMTHSEPVFAEHSVVSTSGDIGSCASMDEVKSGIHFETDVNSEVVDSHKLDIQLTHIPHVTIHTNATFANLHSVTHPSNEVSSSTDQTVLASTLPEDPDITFVDNAQTTTPNTKQRRFSFVNKTTSEAISISPALIQSSSLASRFSSNPASPTRRAPTRPK